MAQVPIFYINLESRPDRRAFMERQLAELGLSAERIVAVTPAQLPPDRHARYSNPRRYRWMTPTELACSSSHGLALRAAIDNGSSHALILEDDAVLSPDLPRLLSEACSGPAIFDVLRIETTINPVRFSPRRIGLTDGFDARQATGWCPGSAGYIVGRHAADVLLSSDTLFEMPIDEILFNPYRPLAKQLTILHCDPALCFQPLPGSSLDAGPSDVEAARVEGSNSRQALPLQLRIVYGVGLFLDRDIRMGVSKLWHQLVGGSRKETVPFSGTLPASVKASDAPPLVSRP